MPILGHRIMHMPKGLAWNSTEDDPVMSYFEMSLTTEGLRQSQKKKLKEKTKIPQQIKKLGKHFMK